MIDFVPGYLVDVDETGHTQQATWIPQIYKNDHAAIADLDHHGLEILVQIDGQTIYHVPVTEAGSMQAQAADTDDPGSHLLTVTLSGYQDRHMPLISPDRSNRSAVKIERMILEGIDISEIFADRNSSGGCVFSGNGHYEFGFTTPVYRWLLDQARWLKLITIED